MFKTEVNISLATSTNTFFLNIIARSVPIDGGVGEVSKLVVNYTSSVFFSAKSHQTIMVEVDPQRVVASHYRIQT